MRGTFIAFEGLDGSGKSTVLKLVAEKLRDQGLTVVTSREPGGTPLGSAIRELILGQDYRPTARAELLLMCADRAEHVATLVEPALASGAIVLSDRFEASTRAYQGGGLAISDDQILPAIQAATNGLVPDLYILFDIDPDVALNRRLAESEAVNSLDQRTPEFRNRVRDKYLAMAATEPNWSSIDASLPLDDVVEAALRAINAILAPASVNS